MPATFDGLEMTK